MKISKTASILILLLFLSMAFISEGAQSQTLPDNTIFIDPPNLIDETNTLTSFTININISYIEGLHGWQIYLRYNPELLYTNSSLIKEGSFLRSGGSTFWAPPLIEEDYLTIGSTITTYAWADGTGTLANITFYVNERGETTLHLYATVLDDVDIKPISHDSQDGYFRNIELAQMPVAKYTYVAQAYNITFNASSSYSPTSTIRSYLWFWGGIGLDIRNTSTTNPVTFHLYYETDPPVQNATVRLIATDSNNVTGDILVTTIKFGIAVHDVAVLSVGASPHSVLVGNYSTTTIGVNISNNGNQLESTTLTISYNSTDFDFQNLTATQWTPLYTTPVNGLAGLEIRTVDYVWNTTGYAQGFYAIKAEASPVPEETNTTNNVQTGSVRIVTVLHAPIPEFSFYPTSPYAFQGVSFNASRSYDSDGTIESYTWNFGDSNSTTATESSIIHVYRKAGTFTVTLTVIDDDAIRAEKTMSITVHKLATSTSISVSPSATVISVGSTAVISGQVANIQSSMNITIFNRPSDTDIWSILKNIKTDQNGLFSHEWIPSSAGTYEFKAEMNGDDAHEASTSNILLIVTKYISTITLSANRENASLGQTITLNGSIEPSTSSAMVTVEYKLNNGSWNTLTTCSTNQTGWYTFNWRPDTAGSYLLRAKWTGNDQSIGSESTTKTVTVASNSPDMTTYAIYTIIIIAIIAVATVLILRRRH